MKRVLREDIERQRQLMNLHEQDPSWADAIKDFIVKGFKDLFGDEEETTPESSDEKVKVGQSKFEKIIGKIIDTIEGGYYHPSMVAGGRGYPKGDRSMGDSGETMFGIDRKHGDKINTTPSGVRFWNTIDSADASTKWPWNYRGGKHEGFLKSLATKMIKDTFDQYAQRYLSDEAREIVLADENLMAHFGYATWNGPGWFRRFAQSINKEVEGGTTDPKSLMKKGLLDRKNSSNRLISSSAEKIEKITGTNYV